MTRSLGLAATAASAVALLAGCGSSSNSSSATSASTAASTPAQSTAATTTTTAAATPGVTVQTKKGKLGTILAAGPKRLTVYLFEADKGSQSACSGACAKAWPPVTSSGTPVAGGGAVGADLGTITRADGTKQITYKGHPLYYFVKDGDSGDAYGEGSTAFGAGWYVLKPNGTKLDKS